MNRDPFLRAALIVTVAGFAAALYVLFGWWRALVFAAVGVVGAVFLAEDYTPPAPRQVAERRADRPRVDADGKPVNFERISG